MPFFSIILATYNCEKTIKRAIDSILSQDFNDYEIIIIDGGSTDNTLAIIDNYESAVFGHRVSEPDSGIYDAWNKGVSAAGGKWIAFLGADDYFERDALKVYHKYIEETSVTLEYVSSRVNLVNSSGKITRVIGKLWSWRQFRTYMCVAHVGSMHHHSLYQTYGFYNINYKIVGDYELLLRANENLKAGYINYVTANMQVGGTSNRWYALVEAMKAKIESGKLSRGLALAQFVVANLKFTVRKLLYES